jgi:hypothetical protein
VTVRSGRIVTSSEVICQSKLLEEDSAKCRQDPARNMSRPKYLRDRLEQLLQKEELPAYRQLAGIWDNLRHIIRSQDIIKRDGILNLPRPLS